MNRSFKGNGSDRSSVGVEFSPCICAIESTFDEASESGNIVIRERDGNGFDGGMEFAEEGRESIGKDGFGDTFSVPSVMDHEESDGSCFVIREASEDVDDSDMLSIL